LPKAMLKFRVRPAGVRYISSFRTVRFGKDFSHSAKFYGVCPHSGLC
jgi:hypothetical protein